MNPRRFVPRPLWLALWLLVPLFAAKAAHWGAPAGDYGVRDFVRDLFVSTSADVAFAAGFGLAAAALLLAVRRSPRLEMAMGAVLLGLGTFCAVYAVASVQIFAFLRSPLTYPLLYLAGDASAMRSSIGAFLSPVVFGAMVLTAIAYPILVWLCSRGEPVPRRARAAATALLALALLWAWQGGRLAAGRWSDRSDVLIARNPHWEFLSSVTTELSGRGGPQMSDAFPEAFLADFRPQLPRAARPQRETRPLNVLLLVLESTGARYMSLYGSPYRTTPQLDAEAQHALVFDSFYAHVGLTANSLMAMSLSIYPYMTWREYTLEYPRFPGRTMAQLLKARGYRTSFLSSTFLDHGGLDRFLEGRGFDEVGDFSDFGHGEPVNSWGGSDAALVDKALAWIDADRAQPFYGVLWTHASHHPYDPVPGQTLVDFFAGQKLPPDDYDLGRYLNTLAEVDRQVGRLLAGLRERGLENDTIVIVTGDHGETFGDPHPTWGHGFRLYQESVRVPLVIWSPALFPKGSRAATIGGHVDLNPTVADLLSLPADPDWEGRSLLAPGRPPRAYFYAANDDYLLGVREGRYKYVYDASRGRDELFDLTRDPSEQTNLAGSQPETCSVLRQRLAAWKRHAALRLSRARDASGAGARDGS